jgi:hypothetical protein
MSRLVRLIEKLVIYRYVTITIQWRISDDRYNSTCLSLFNRLVSQTGYATPRLPCIVRASSSIHVSSMHPRPITSTTTPPYALNTLTFCLIPFLQTGQAAALLGLVLSCCIVGLCCSEHHLHMTKWPQGRQATSAVCE